MICTVRNEGRGLRHAWGKMGNRDDREHSKRPDEKGQLWSIEPELGSSMGGGRGM